MEQSNNNTVWRTIDDEFIHKQEENIAMHIRQETKHEHENERAKWAQRARV